MKVPVTPLVRAQVEQAFSCDEAAAVCTALGEAELPLINLDGERVHLAIVHLAAGDLAKFHTQLALAKVDWRDVLVADGLANVGWHLVLQARGIDPSSLAITAHLRASRAHP